MSGFVDEVQIHVKAGDGGAGAVSFRREAHVDKGGPDGGDGARGGDVWLVATTNQSSLLAFRDHPHRRAGNGGHGGGKKKHGAQGADLEVLVPVGTKISDNEGTVLADLVGPGDRWMAAEGGRGGRGNASFLSNRRRAPAFAEQGETGHEQWYDMELALVADVALVGFPNVGKSTLISRISAAKPKIADYPFTTLEPNLGVVRTAEDVNFTVADIPGLVEGAADGKGLGHRFLRHVTRARVLLVLLELEPVTGITPEEQGRVLLDELGRYRPELLDRPRFVVGSKADVAGMFGSKADVAGMVGSKADVAGIVGSQADVGGRVGSTVDVGDRVGSEAEPGTLVPDLLISAVTGQGIPELLGALSRLVTEARAAVPEGDGTIVIHRPLPAGIIVDKVEDGVFAGHRQGSRAGRLVERRHHR